MTAPIAVYDASVLYPAPLRDLLMHLAVADLVRARWTDLIHDEWTRNVLAKRPDLTSEQIQRTRRLMDENVLDCLVTGFGSLIPKLSLPDPDDRHVLAAAIHARAQVIITFNLRHFPPVALQPHGIQARNPDDFIISLARHQPDKVLLAAQRQRASLKRPPMSVTEYLATLEQQRLPKTAAWLSTNADSI